MVVSPEPDDFEEITRRLNDFARGDSAAGAEALRQLYADLKRLAAAYLGQERPGHTLQPTALVHEAFLRIADYSGVKWNSRSHFLAVAAQIMRRILVDYARARRTQKRGEGALPMELGDGQQSPPNQRWEVVEIDLALNRLTELNERQARVVEMRFFGGMLEEEIAEVLGLSARTVKRDWVLARAWLYGELKGTG